VRRTDGYGSFHKSMDVRVRVNLGGLFSGNLAGGTCMPSSIPIGIFSGVKRGRNQRLIAYFFRIGAGWFCAGKRGGGRYRVRRLFGSRIRLSGVDPPALDSFTPILSFEKKRAA